MSADTIFALATGGGRSAVAVIRLSGPSARMTLTALTSLQPEARIAHYARFRDPETGETLDRGLALYFPAPHSATGEDCAEFHLHGGRAVIDGILSLLGRRSGLRHAEPGEFARRAFINGKMDLSQAEALADLIDAETAFQRRQALRVAGGELRRQVEQWRGALLESLAIVAAELDFSDEADVEGFSHDALQQLLAPVISRMQEILSRAPASERLREGFLVLILGPPNAGKSTLLNRLAQRDVAIVSEYAGTTRDMIEVQLDVGGMPVTLVDTAGLREAEEAIERIGVARTRERAGEADLLLWLSEGGLEPLPIGLEGGNILRVATKSDRIDPSPGALGLSAETGLGLDALCGEIAKRARNLLGDGESALVIRERHRAGIEQAQSYLDAAIAPNSPLEIVSEDIKLAARSLERIVGVIEVEQVLDVVFSRFCIGK